MSSFTYDGYSYPYSYSQNGVWDVDVDLIFEHVSPTDGVYGYKVKYWYFDQTAGESTSPDYFSSPPLTESSGAHSSTQSHTFTIRLGLTAGHTYIFNAELWYSAAGGTWTASALGQIGRKTITVKAANESGGSSGGSGSGTISGVTKSVSENGVTIQWSFTPDSSTTAYFRGHVTLGTSYQDTSSVASKYSSMTQGNSGTITFVVQFSGLSSETYYTFQISMESGSSAQNMASIGVGHVGYFTTSGSGGEEEYEESVSARVVSKTDRTTTLSITVENPYYTGKYYSPYIVYSTTSGNTSISNLNSDNETYFSSSISQYASGNDLSFTVTLTDLSPSTTYYYRVYATYADDSGMSTNWSYIQDSYTGQQNFTTEAQIINLLKWSWNHASGSWNVSKSANSSSDTYAAYTAVTTGGPTTDFPFNVWNDISRWIKYNLDQLGASYNNSDYNNALMNVSNKILTATRWNNMCSLWNTLTDALEGGYSASSFHMGTKSSGDSVLGSFFTNLVTYMNINIDNYNS